MISLLLVYVIFGLFNYNGYFTSKDQIAWENYQKTFNKSYNTVSETELRREIFLKNLNKINHHNSLKNITFLRSINQFTDMTFDELYQLNYSDDDDDLRSNDNSDHFKPPMVFERKIKRHLALPKNFDWRQKGLNTSVKNQGLCGSCYIFSTLESLENLILLKTGKHFEFSRQEVIDCGHKHSLFGCDGGHVYGVYSYINRVGGLSLEKDYKFVGKTSECNEENCHKRIKFQVKKLIEYDTEDTEELLMDILYDEGPIIVEIDNLNESFFQYSTGIYYEENCNAEGRMPTHVVLMIGYGRTDDGIEFWTVKNSYGKEWGEDGYMRIARNKNSHCKIASYNLMPVIDEQQFTQDHHQLKRNKNNS